MSNLEIILAVVIPFLFLVGLMWAILLLRWRKQYQRDLMRLNTDYDNLLRELQTVRIEKINNTLTALEIQHRSNAQYRKVLAEMSASRDKIRAEAVRVADLIEEKRVETKPTSRTWPGVFKNFAHANLRKLQDAVDNIEHWEREFYARADDVSKGYHYTRSRPLIRIARKRSGRK